MTDEKKEAGSSIKELLVEYNEAAEKAGAKSLSAWKGSKDALRSKIEALRAHSGSKRAEISERKAKEQPKSKAKAKAKGEKKDAKPRGPGIGTYVKELLEKGRNTEQVLVAVKQKFPEAKTTAACVRWYASKFRRQAAEA